MITPKNPPPTNAKVDGSGARVLEVSFIMEGEMIGSLTIDTSLETSWGFT